MTRARFRPSVPCHPAVSIALAVALSLALPAPAATVAATVVDSAGKPVADAVVYAVPVAGTIAPARPLRHASIEQADREFVPYVTVIQTGTTVNFPNRDPLMHHVYSFSPVKNFEIKLYSGDAPRGILFDKPGAVTLGCNIHDWMIGYIFVVDTPYFAKTSQAGQAQLGELVAGEFEVRAWHPRQRGSAPAKPARLDARGSANLEFTLDVAPRKPPFKPPANPISYK